MWWPDGTVYQGDFFEGFRDGNGLHDTANGDRYEERVVKNKSDGEGSFTGQMANLTTGGLWELHRYAYSGYYAINLYHIWLH